MNSSMWEKNIYLLNYFKDSKGWNNFATAPPPFNDVAQDGL